MPRWRKDKLGRGVQGNDPSWIGGAVDQDEEVLSLAEINARGRKKAAKRALRTAVTVIPGVIVALPAIFTLGMWVGMAGAVGVSVAVGLVLEVLFPIREDD